MLSLLPVVLNRIKSLYKLTIIMLLILYMEDISGVIKNINKIQFQYFYVVGWYNQLTINRFIDIKNNYIFKLFTPGF